ncbi:bestrophin family ion channel [Paucibacter sediminis]|uniref:Bestrophin family ion channel n=1 Tax=Paucibacter sediminis TaxID=3019553 RepID=A0AA95NAH7_9BURK|nr:bestrophin family ion channel [Paucibacter sp. S2-9]WIT10449.1 bestrophin family ion channel [Paucibacter sp. S2-9]
MIVRDRPSGLRLFLVVRGSILKQIRWVLLVNVLVAVAVTWSHGDLFSHKITLTTIPFTLIGLPLAIFLGFRNNAAYDRYWEARKLWGELLLRSRNLARQTLSLIDLPDGPAPDAPPPRGDLGDVRVRLLYRMIAVAQALKHQLRGTRDVQGEVAALLRPEEAHRVAGLANPAAALLLEAGEDLRRCRRAGQLDSVRAAALDATLSAISAAAASCERIKSSPLPFSYTLLLHRTAYLYCFLLPFGLVDSIGFMTPFVVGIVAYTFFGLDALGDEIEEPFGLLPNDLPLDAICRGIEIDLRQALGERDTPPPLQPVDYCLM